MWARGEVRRTLVRVRIPAALSGGSSGVVRSTEAARTLAEVIRERTIGPVGRWTYAETDEYLAADGSTTSELAAALLDERGNPIANPDYVLWVHATALQTALMQAHLAFRLADLSLGVGVALVLAGAGIAARR